MEIDLISYYKGKKDLVKEIDRLLDKKYSLEQIYEHLKRTYIK